METLTKIFYKACNLLAKGAAWCGMDGLLHIIICTIMGQLVLLIFPWWAMVLVMILVGIVKEALDRVTRMGTAERKDLVCDLIGVLIALI